MLKRIFIIRFLILICWLKLENTVACNDNVQGVEVIDDEACIEAIDDHLIPSIGFIIGQSYTFEAQVPPPVDNDVDDDIIWSSSSLANNDLNASFTITITDVITIITVQVSYYYPNPNIQSTTYKGKIKITASQPPLPYLGICTELCPGVGLKSAGFENTGFDGDESAWTRTAGYIHENGYYQYTLFPGGLTSPEHEITDGAGYTNFPENTPFESEQGYDPFTDANQKAIALGHGNTRDKDGVDYYLAKMEQTFFVGENYEPKLDIWYSWVTEVAAEESLKTQPVFSVKLFRFYEDRNSSGDLITVKEEIYSHIDTQETYDQASGNKRWRHWWDKKTIDLTPYKLERLHIEITSYDREYQDTDFNSMAFVDISCSTCCTPSEVNKNYTQDLTVNPVSNGIVNISRPRKICEGPEDPKIPFNESGDREKCNPLFFYQIIAPNGEPYVIESEGIEVPFRPAVPGTYQIRYKENASCCWSAFQEFSVAEGQLKESGVAFSNDLKNAAVSCVPSFEMNEVLAVNVASFGDRQLVDPKDIVTSNRKTIASELKVTEPKNPYITGERGIWRTEASYAYVTDREGYEKDKKMNAVKEGGTFGLNMFNWTTQGVVPENWRRVNHVSRYDGYTHEIENRDILGRYSSALYGYNGQLSTAVASNAAYYEIANEGFDAYNETDIEDNIGLINCSSPPEQAENLQIVPYEDEDEIDGIQLSPHDIGYVRGKYYAFRIDFGNLFHPSNGYKCSKAENFNWQIAPPFQNLLVDAKYKCIIRIPQDENITEFTLRFRINASENCQNLPHAGKMTVCAKGFINQSPTPIQTETNFEINNLYEDGDKDRNVILQVLWAKGEKGVLEGYTPGEKATVTLDASVLAYTIGKQGATDITPNLSVNKDENEYTIDEKVKITLTHRDAATSWFTLEPKGDYEFPEEWTEKNEQWYGAVRLARTLPPIGEKRNYQGLIPVAHTGNQGLVPSEDIIIQEKLLLIPNKEYVFSAWVKLNTSDDQPYTYGNVVGADLSFYANGKNAAIQPAITINPTGAIIEGWQRIEGTFTVPAKSMFTGVKLTQPNAGAVYDDVRIYPADGMMKTYVYNPSNYLLQAVLDENNYATLYYYDEEQRLYLVQKETREGVQSIQETRSYIKPKNDGE